MEDGLLKTIQTNPFRKGLPVTASAGQWVFVLFGATGDLARKKILPALYSLHCFGLLPEGTVIVGFASPEMTISQYREFVENSINEYVTFKNEPHTIGEFLQRVLYTRRGSDGYQTLADAIKSIAPSANCLFYMAVPQEAAATHIQGLEQVGLGGYGNSSFVRRVIVEKPFGRDYESCRSMNQLILDVFPEDYVFRIDHYLGKETVQNILTLRFANQFLEPLLNNNHIDNIQISIAETVGVEGRGGFYDKTGALRDVIQNHALQMMSLVMMEQPLSLDADNVGLAKSRLLGHVQTDITSGVNTIAARGRYAGSDLHTKTPGENLQVRAETFAAIKLDVNNERWAGVPVFIRTGKCLAKRVTSITLVFKSSCPLEFGELAHCNDRPNVINIQVQPNEGVSISMEAKLPGSSFATRPVMMDFKYGTSIHERVPDAYERLILDAFSGDRMLFAGASEIESMWRICDPILSAWENDSSDIDTYAPGSWGPQVSDAMISGFGRKWRRL